MNGQRRTIRATFSKRISIALASMIALSWATHSWCAEWDELTRTIPPTANAILVVNSAEIQDRCVQSGREWRNGDCFGSMLPPVVDRLVLSAGLDIAHLNPNWEIGSMSVNRQLTVDAIQRRVGGTQDVINDMTAVKSPSGSFVIPTKDDQVTFARLAQRQWVAQQLRASRQRDARQLPWLLSTAADQVANGDSQIAVAVVLADAISPADIRNDIQNSPLLRDQRSPEQLAAELASIEGILFTINISDDIRGQLKVMFKKYPVSLTPIAKPFIIDSLAAAGATLPEFSNWEASRQGNGLMLSGRLSTDSVRRVLSLLRLESEEIANRSELDSANSSASGKVTVRRTDAYVKRVTRLVDDVVNSAKDNNLREQVLWTDRCAKTVSRVSTAHVERGVAKFGDEIAEGLYEIVALFHSANDTAEQRIAATNPPPVEFPDENLVPYNRYGRRSYSDQYYTPFSYARVNIQSNAQKANAIANEEAVRANESAKSMLGRVEDLVRKMNKRNDTHARYRSALR